MLVRIRWMLYQLQNIFSIQPITLYLLVNPKLSREFLEIVQRHLLNSEHQVCDQLLPQIKFIRLLIALWEQVYFMHQGPYILCHISMNYQRLLHLNSRRSGFMNFVRYKCFFLINTIDTVPFQTLFKSQNWWLKFFS